MSIYLILFIIFSIAAITGLWAMFEKAGEPGWKILIPLYNFYVWLRIIHKPLWWYIFLLIPFINVFTVMLMVVESLKNFKKFGLGQQALAVIFPYIYLPYLGFSQKETFTPTPELPKIKKSIGREWLDAIIFAVIAASIIRTFLVEAYTIPTSSMEKSLLIGDFLFVSKITYGPKVPNTPISFPFVHHTLPLTENTKSFVEWVKLPYYRFPGLSEINHRDVVVFNFPVGDTVATKASNMSYYSLVRNYGREAIHNNPRTFGKVIYRPMDKRDNYVKRCIGLPGDTLEIVDRKVFINEKKKEKPKKAQFEYIVKTDGTPIHPRLMERYNITEGDTLDRSFSRFKFAMTDEAKEKVRKLPNVKKVSPKIAKDGAWDKQIFPHDSTYAWNVDNFGPIYIPAKGKTVNLNTDNIALYKRIIDVYEKNDLKIRNNNIYINGKQTDSYTFEMDYYWMMGDNRHNSMDSRYWGFVPINHIVGKVSFVWLSLDYRNGEIRLDKMFRIIE